MAKKLAELSEKAKEVLSHLEENGASTIAEMKKRGLKGINSAHLVALRTRGLVSDTDIEVEVPTIAKRVVKQYQAIKSTETETE